ncbi:MAG: ribonuclease H-like domain-containing protein [Treponema sp.]|jgi:uncharacterized protein YprB with RNaseH-like and TPR domain|nr:ribonuclease H-like domain-containing protein [Treponema sp.]
MANLRDRLRRIQEQKETGTAQAEHTAADQSSIDTAFFEKQGWKSCGYLSLKRETMLPWPVEMPEKLPPALMILVPDLERICKSGKLQTQLRPQPQPQPQIDDFLFFDLETSGLSGGAGTVAFLAAFGRLAKNYGGISLRITQYLLLDYPGENEFLEALLGEFNDKGRIIVSYNGKSFDSQILKTRCLMNRIQAPQYFHVDLLHPARRLWKTALEDCSQGTIETRILKLDRSGDTPGSLAPEIWFDFLKTGNAERLMGICDHNCLDIVGLAAIFSVMSFIAEDPCGTTKRYRYDIEQLALRWREFVRQTDTAHDDLRLTGIDLLRLAAKQRYPRASLAYARDLLKGGNFSEGRKRLKNIAVGNFPENIRAGALRALAIDSERRLKNIAEALEFAQQGLRLQLTGETWRQDFERRCERLEQKIVELS